jgi:hypothetical protein
VRKHGESWTAGSGMCGTTYATRRTMHSNAKIQRLHLTLAAIVLLSFPACEVAHDGLESEIDADAGVELSTLSQAIDPVRTPEPMPDVPFPPARIPADPSLPRIGTLTTMKVDLRNLVTFLGGTRISLDATKTAPPVYQGTHPVCSRPSGYTQAVNDCREFTGVRRERCLRAADARYPEQCVQRPTPHHSYISPGGIITALAPDVKDVVFPFERIVKDVKLGRFTAVVNQIGATLAPDNITLTPYTTRHQETNIVARIDLESPQPTVYCYRDGLLGCPNIELYNIQVDLTLLKLMPTADKRGIQFSTARAELSFERNLNLVPDPLVNLFYDLDAAIRDKAEAKLKDAVNAQRDKVAAALTAAISATAGPAFKGFRGINEVISDGRYLYIHYEPLARTPTRLEPSPPSRL